MNTPPSPPYDALLLVSFGGPEGEADVLPFLENVLRGRNVPRERLLEVAEHYYHFGGVSPINAQNRALIAALEVELKNLGIALPVYWGNRNWRPMLADTLAQMQRDGVRRALAFATAAYSSYSACRQYLENIEAARQTLGDGAPLVDKLRTFSNHPGFIETMVERTREALAALPAEQQSRAILLFSAHSIPLAMAETCRYEAELHEAARLIGERVQRHDWEIVYQSRSGPPQQPWLEPDVCAVLRRVAVQQPGAAVVIVPLGFISDHMEVVYDLDTEARAVCGELGLTYVRAPTAGTHPRFVRMIGELIAERVRGVAARPTLGSLPACPDVCPPDCCRYIPTRGPSPAAKN